MGLPVSNVHSAAPPARAVGARAARPWSSRSPGRRRSRATRRSRRAGGAPSAAARCRRRSRRRGPELVPTTTRSSATAGGNSSSVRLVKRHRGRPRGGPTCDGGDGAGPRRAARRTRGSGGRGRTSRRRSRPRPTIVRARGQAGACAPRRSGCSTAATPVPASSATARAIAVRPRNAITRAPGDRRAGVPVAHGDGDRVRAGGRAAARSAPWPRHRHPRIRPPRARGPPRGRRWAYSRPARPAGLPRQTNVTITPTRKPMIAASTTVRRRFGRAAGAAGALREGDDVRLLVGLGLRPVELLLGEGLLGDGELGGGGEEQRLQQRAARRRRRRPASWRW